MRALLLRCLVFVPLGLAAGCDGDDAAQADAGHGDLLTRLSAIPGLSAVEHADAPNLPDGHRFFALEYDQPVDHTHPEGQRFIQHMTLLVVDEHAPMVQYSGGYGLSPQPFRVELTRIVSGNQLAIEHRYFLGSTPIPTDWSYLDIEQAAGDFHRINQALRGIFDGKWLATGGSKGGMTALFFRRFYPDDIDVTVPYVAPILHSGDDPRFAPFIEQAGDDPGCVQDLFDFQRAALSARAEILPLIDADAAQKGWRFDLLGAERAFEHAVLELPFAFWQYSDATLCPAVPADSASAGDLYAFLDAVNGMSGYTDGTLGYFLAYYYQSATQFGWPKNANEAELADLMNHENTDVPAVYAASTGAPTAYDPQAMADIRAWVASSCERFLFVYGENDPWSAAMVDFDAGRDCHRFIQPGGNHGSRIQGLAPADRDAALELLGDWLGVPVALPAEKPGSTELTEDPYESPRARFGGAML